MTLKVQFAMTIDETQLHHDGSSDWHERRIFVAIEEVIRAAAGFAVPFTEGLALSVGAFQITNER